MQNMQHRYPGMGMPSMQNMQNMQNRYPGEGERGGERERDQTRESRTVRGGDAGGYRRDNQGQKVNGPSRRNVEINKQITVCQDSRDLCALIDAHAAEFNNVNVVSAFRKLLQSRREGLHSGVVERALQVLEAAALRTIGAFDAQSVANILHIIAKTRYSPRDQSLVPQLEGRTETLAGTFNAQEVANTLWAYATMGREPGAGVMRGLEGRAEALAGTFNAQNVANSLWAACVFSLLCASDAEFPWVDTVMQRLVSLDKSACFNSAELCQLHQFFLSCSVETRLVVEAIKDMQALKDTCRVAFEGAQTNPSASQQQVSETLRHMGLSVEDEVRCPKSGYSIDMIVHGSTLEIGGERSIRGGLWAVEFDGPSHFLASGAPTGATLLKRWHLHVLGHALVSVPCWEWDRCKGACEREQYLRDKLEAKPRHERERERERDVY